MIVTNRYYSRHRNLPNPEATIAHVVNDEIVDFYHIIETPSDPDEYREFMEEAQNNPYDMSKLFTIKEGNFRILPTYYKHEDTGIKDDDSLRDIYYIFGPSGSGKTTTATAFARLYRQMYPNNPIYLFSPQKPKNKPGSLSELNPIVFDVSNPDIAYANFVANPLAISDFADSLVIFDDLEGAVTDKKVLQGINQLMNLILTNGRHYRTSVIYCKHVAAGGYQTKTTFTETNYIIMFPFRERPEKLEYVLKRYCGMSDAERRYISSDERRTRPLFISMQGTGHVVGDRYIWVRSK